MYLDSSNNCSGLYSVYSNDWSGLYSVYSHDWSGLDSVYSHDWSGLDSVYSNDGSGLYCLSYKHLVDAAISKIIIFEFNISLKHFCFIDM